ncbi:related to TVP38 - Integral membrane protein localized to vesicles along with the v-SNARE Tlg2p [Cephalotrichum gorgonifer]|uniref:Golgi apparatus membrane protein TVP38 n=1 Tax=Cephalotrichum gorgonifer TaxID=2041049 RepID=A0AAE8SR23_9PEZI|nr:related to TVP38 - Integral membrane protein localized to vesicles along with the v-SNARE Tlg2p [Cephalotrichum gorgonifer]
MPGDYFSAARALSLSPTPRSPAVDRPFTRPRTASSARLSNAPRRGTGNTFAARLRDNLYATGYTTLRAFLLLSPAYRLLALLGSLALFIFCVLFLAYSGRIFTALAPIAKSWRETTGAWLVIWLVVFVAAFPPLIGYSTATTVAGFIYGFPHAWPIVATASTAGSLASFVASRTVLSGYVNRLVGRDHRFVALGQVLRREGIMMLTMIRFCPLPYSLSNGFLATIPSIGPLPFAVSTALASPKLLVHVFIGSRIALLVEEDASMSAGTKALNYISMALSAAVGVTVGWVIYRRTMARAAEIALETAGEEGLASPGGTFPSPRMGGIMEDGGYMDGADPGDVLADVDDISLWDGDGGAVYRDESTDRLTPSSGFATGNGKGVGARG